MIPSILTLAFVGSNRNLSERPRLTPRQIHDELWRRCCSVGLEERRSPTGILERFDAVVGLRLLCGESFVTLERPVDGSAAAPLQLVEETLRVDKRIVETGRVRVRTIIDEEPVVVSATLSSNYVTVDRVAIDRVVDAVPPTREVNGVMIISVVEERLRVVRELVLVEEVHMRNVRTFEPFEQTVSRRVMRAVVERDSTEQGD